MRTYTLAQEFPPDCRIPHLENNTYIYGTAPVHKYKAGEYLKRQSRDWEFKKNEAEVKDFENAYSKPTDYSSNGYSKPFTQTGKVSNPYDLKSEVSPIHEKNFSPSGYMHKNHLEYSAQGNSLYKERNNEHEKLAREQLYHTDLLKRQEMIREDIERSNQEYLREKTLLREKERQQDESLKRSQLFEKNYLTEEKDFFRSENRQKSRNFEGSSEKSLLREKEKERQRDESLKRSHLFEKNYLTEEKDFSRSENGQKSRNFEVSSEKESTNSKNFNNRSLKRTSLSNEKKLIRRQEIQYKAGQRSEEKIRNVKKSKKGAAYTRSTFSHQVKSMDHKPYTFLDSAPVQHSRFDTLKVAYT